MNVEQTSQLIQLILNSVLMALVCALVWVVLLLCHSVLEQQLQGLRQEWSDFGGDRPPDPVFKQRLYQVRQRYRATHRSMAWVGYGLQCCGASIFALSLRAVWGWNGLISGAMLLFMAGCGLFWFGVLVMLLAIYRTGWRWHRSDRLSLDRPHPPRQLPGRDARPAVSVLQSGGRSPIPPYAVPKSKPYLN
jgi:hypothetical protein